MQRLSTMALVLSVAPCLGAQQPAIAGGVANGAAATPNSEWRPAHYTTQLRGAGFIDFDDHVQPPVFASALPLQNFYQSLGVTFLGPTLTDGGAALDEAGNFGVTGHSSPNFLAFNVTARYASGAIPRPPEEIWFRPAVDSVQFLVGTGSGIGQPVTAVAYAVGGQVVDTASVTLGTAMQPLTVSGSCISRIVVDTSATWLVIDDLAYTPSSCPHGVGRYAALRVGERAGTSLSLDVDAPPASTGYVLLSASPGPLNTSIGTLRVGLPLLAALGFSVDGSGTAALRLPLPTTADGLGIAQAIALDPSGGPVLISNPAVVRL